MSNRDQCAVSLSSPTDSSTSSWADDRFGGSVELGADTRIALLGAGVEGMAVLAWLQRLGCRNLTVCDKDDSIQLPEGVEGQLGDDYMRDLDSYQVIFRSPGFPRDLASIQDAESRGSLVTSATYTKTGSTLATKALYCVLTVFTNVNDLTTYKSSKIFTIPKLQS